MIISWLGDAGIRIQTKDTVVLIDPPAASTGLKPTKQAAAIVAISETDGRDAKSVTGDPLIINTPGEYERQNIFVYGLQLPGDPDRVHFRVEAEEMSLGHLGGLNAKLDNGQLAALEGVDILFIPVGGKSVIDAETAATIINQIEPRIVIPIQHTCPGSTAGYANVSAFLKEFGAKTITPTDKLKVIKKDLPADETRVEVLTM
jgi:L-ascorbate metabolism protein UlaG (beta-lactamase superfamily)